MSDLNNFFTEEVGKRSDQSKKIEKKLPRIYTRNKNATNLTNLKKEDFFELLEPVINLLPGFSADLAWTRQEILPNKPNISPEELATILKIPLLEAYFILDRLKNT